MAATARELRKLDVPRPFNRAQARAAGLRLRGILGPQFHKILYDSYVSSSVPITARLRAEAAFSISAPGAYVSHCTAAELWGGVVPDARMSISPFLVKRRAADGRVSGLTQRPDRRQPPWFPGSG